MDKYKDFYLRFYECCKPIQGFNRGSIYDFQRGLMFIVSNEIIQLIEKSKQKKLNEILNEYKRQNDLLRKQLDFLYSNELIFFAKNPENFAPMNLKIEKPNPLEFIYLKIDTLSYQKQLFLEKIDKTGINTLILIFSEKTNLELLKKTFKILEYSKIKIIDLMIKYEKGLTKKIEKTIYGNPRVRRIVYNNTFKNSKNNSENIIFVEHGFQNILNKGITSFQDFTVNLDSFLESQFYNLFYYKKIFIEDNGDIYRYFGDSYAIGNIYENELTDIIKDKKLKEFWKTTKDKIEECCECEFRYVCPDNRIPIQNKKNQKYLHSTNCKYDPKTNLWN